VLDNNQSFDASSGQDTLALASTVLKFKHSGLWTIHAQKLAV
jgi:hypothetical protein